MLCCSAHRSHDWGSPWHSSTNRPGRHPTGTSFLIEDVTCPVDKLAAMTVDLVEMFDKYGYKDASCFGHALEGNLHLVFSQVLCLRPLSPRCAEQPMQVTRISESKHRLLYTFLAARHTCRGMHCL